MHVTGHKNQKETATTLLELLLQLHGDFRRQLDPIKVTPLQAGVLLFLRRHPGGRATDAALALGVSLPTMSEVVKDLVRKRWVSKRRSVQDDRVVLLSLSRQGAALTRQIEQRVHDVETSLPEQDRRDLSVNPKGSRA